MTIAPITANPPPERPATTSLDPASNSLLDRQAFLKLLVAQLKYQDPSSPMDASEMISQSAQLSMVEKLNDISTALSAIGANERLMQGGALIGKDVTFLDEDGNSITRTVSSARLVDGSLILAAGEWDVPLAAVTGIAAPPPIATSAEPIDDRSGSAAMPAAAASTNPQSTGVPATDPQAGGADAVVDPDTGEPAVLPIDTTGQITIAPPGPAPIPPPAVVLADAESIEPATGSSSPDPTIQETPR
jgi:hypothetical protein